MKRRWRISFIILLFYLIAALFGGRAWWLSVYHQQTESNLSQLGRLSDQLSSQLDKYAYIPRLLSKDSELIDALTRPDNRAQVELTNRYLENVNRIIQASDTYLLDLEGTTVAASNWQSEGSFVGRNFSFRPYFQKALTGKQGHYFALGSTSGKRGFYYSYPVIYAAEVIGIIVVKTNLSDIERVWKSQEHYFVVTDNDGVVFMSSKPEWLFHSLLPVSGEKQRKITRSQRYLDLNIHSLGFIADHETQTGELRQQETILYSGMYLSAKQHIAAQDLTVRVLSPKVALFWSTFGFLIVITLIFSLILACWLLFRNRQIKQRQIAQIEAESKQKLEFQVMERTAELQVEIREREKTEKMLMQTQEELIQAAKLAVLGEMSASISHELNNPLAAIRSFAENGKRFLEKGQPERTTDNLSRISALTDRMAKISQQLKSFARRSSSEELVEANVQPVVISALELMKTRLRAGQVHVETDFPESGPKGRINPIQLEQVLINLLANALEALQESEKKQIRVTLSEKNAATVLTVEDSGCGISQNLKSKLFEPFYTTKKNGLGLGLSISLQIMQSMGGSLEIRDSELGGACFDITLSRVAEEKE